jgi:hypothetical protein
LGFFLLAPPSNGREFTIETYIRDYLRYYAFPEGNRECSNLDKASIFDFFGESTGSNGCSGTNRLFGELNNFVLSLFGSKPQSSLTSLGGLKYCGFDTYALNKDSFDAVSGLVLSFHNPAFFVSPCI